MQKESIKFQNSLVFEGMTSIRAIIKGIDTGVNDRVINEILFDSQRLPKISKEIGFLKAVSEKYGFSLRGTDAAEIDSLSLGSSHGGILALCAERTIQGLSALPSLPVRGFYAMIQGIEDPYNFGYAIRSLYACGCDGIILGERNWMSAAGVVCRSSAGASEMLPVYKGDEALAVDCFKAAGYNIVCADVRTENILGKCEIKTPLLLIVGGEKRGISKAILDKADLLVKIPYGREFKSSLSAASAATMFSYEIMRQNDIMKKV